MLQGRLSNHGSQVLINAETGHVAHSTRIDCWRTCGLDFADGGMLPYRLDGTRMVS